jgi:leucyl aminopeptidase (aminopeptidase T)
MNKLTREQVEGALSLIQQGLNLTKGQTLLLLYQADLADAAECIKVAARQSGVQVDGREFRREDFSHGYPESFSPDKLTKFAFYEGIALLIEWSEETTKWRLALLRDLMNQPQGWRIASMPGVDLNGLASCKSDFASIKNYSKTAFAVVARSRLATLQTVNPDGGVDELTIPIGSYLPIISTGEIAPSSWGNFPSGETFVVPNPYKAKGAATIRGSIPMRPLKSNEWVRFRLERGRMRFSSIEASSPDIREQFASLFFTPGGRAKCQNANALAELGIGTNPGIRYLTGKPIFDEKKLGTVHIAFGRNDQFHGPLISGVHHDIVCTGCTLTLHGKYQKYDLIHRGRFNLDEENAMPKLNQFTAFPETRKKVSLGNLVFDFSDDNGQSVLRVKYSTTRENVTFKVAKGECAAAAKRILDRVASEGHVPINQLIGASGGAANKDSCQSIIAGLLEYGLLREVRV